MKRFSVLLISVAILSGFIWLSRSYESVKLDSIASEGNRDGSKKAHSLTVPPSDSRESVGLRESARHAAGDLEIARKHKERFAELDKTIKEQEDKVEERRTVLANIVRTRGMESVAAQTRDEAIKKSLAAQDYLDAKRDFETDLEMLQQMKLQRIAENLKE